ncbi:hypothetical protein TCON_1864 [Astathelohania contejeani]|uniref:Uncharacterized protein n=1 Tax=Astathelohania contejeani TaxID=164912 RepID=A0ABQ7HXQ8_9MICR|nr:hypothetical protein TCON_1864 [Thelohania contejeani]
MFNKIIESLNQQAEKIEEELEKCREDYDKIGNLSILLTKFGRMLKKNELMFNTEERRKQYRIYKHQLNNFNSILREINNARLEKKKVEDEELRTCNLPTAPLTYEENINTLEEHNDTDFIQNSTHRINRYLISAIDSLENLRKQGSYLDNTRNKIKDGLTNIGIGSDVVDKISDRYLNDYYFFMAGVAFVVLIFLLLRFFFK